ncbi:Permease family protein [Candidatus Desulfosporosinus infrequens]|uniref:Permease family protein n=1 Tax=Candidatus Desulfosporosinus infrequens TaxID=2043169 RepID=A0A2U3LB36_9FIRM|nr:Permease family protein [Candidatus Desulfosporosinus infrequens]
MLQTFADYVAYTLFGLLPNSHLGAAVNFFIYDTIKIFLMLATIIFLVSLIRSFFPPERTKKILSHKREFIGNILAALLGIVTPFCSCSAVPVFIGFVESGVPLGVTFSFLISSPMVNEVALIMLWGMFGWKIATIYIATGVTVAIVGGLVIGKLKLEHLVEEYVYNIKMGEIELAVLTWRERVEYAWEYVVDILKKVWLYVIIGIAIGGAMHGYAPADFLVKYAGKDNLFAVPLAVLIGVPLYSNAAGIIPIVHVLMEKGMALGTVLAFMMAVTALSLPEMIILRKVLKPKLLGIFIGIMTVAIIFVGYLFNWIFV